MAPWYQFKKQKQFHGTKLSMSSLFKMLIRSIYCYIPHCLLGRNCCCNTMAQCKKQTERATEFLPRVSKWGGQSFSLSWRMKSIVSIMFWELTEHQCQLSVLSLVSSTVYINLQKESPMAITGVLLMSQ